MPVYTLASQRRLNPSREKQVADTITDIHCAVTGAPPEFVNILFMHGHQLPGQTVLAVIGNVRSGGNRNRELTSNLKAQMLEGIAQAADLALNQVQLDLIGFPASWAMEGGEILPEPGEEEAWLERGRR